MQHRYERRHFACTRMIFPSSVCVKVSYTVNTVIIKNKEGIEKSVQKLKDGILKYENNTPYSFYEFKIPSSQPQSVNKPKKNKKSEFKKCTLA